MKQLPVTILSGFLGAGKTSLLNHILDHSQDLRIAVLLHHSNHPAIDETAGIPIDGSLLCRCGASPGHCEERLAEIAEGCIRCTVPDNLLREATRFAQQDRFDLLVIETSGIAEPSPIASAFASDNKSGRSPCELARLDALVTVVDAAGFLNDFQDLDDHSKRYAGQSRPDRRSLSDLLINQIESANVIVLNKCDLVTRKDRIRLEAILQHLNPEAEIVSSSYGKVPLGVIFKRFDMQQPPPRLSELSETQEYGISSFVYGARRPFHPGRFCALLEKGFPGVLRAKGLFWLASRPDKCGVFSIAGNRLSLGSGGHWVISTPAETSPREQFVYHFPPNWHSSLGDRRQELIFIGTTMEQPGIEESLDQCLLTDEEMAAGPGLWRSYRDPLISWKDGSADVWFHRGL